ncbi:MAG: hypothetical protein ACPGYL_09950, partial [Rhodospirillaceae bacterium]
MSAAEQALNPVEKGIGATIRWTWLFYAVGALYVVGPVLAWSLLGFAVLLLYLGENVRDELRTAPKIHPVLYAWVLGMGVMLVALWAGHFDWGLGTGKTIKSSIGWAKGWALMAIFPLVGAVLPIRRAVLVRAQCVLGLWTLLIFPVLFIAPLIGLPERIFVSPLKAVGGPGPEYFTVYFYTLDPSSWTPRWQFFAPWSPFAGLLGVIMILFALEDKDRRWLIAGVIGGLLMVYFSKSRMSMVALVVCTVGPRMMPLLLRSWAWGLGTAFAVSMAALAQPLLQTIGDGITAFKSARADSTRVREALQRIAHERWEGEAYWFGHGTVEPGPHLVEYMPIGSHHTWFGLLFVKGLVGFSALLVPFSWHFGIVIVDAVRHERAHGRNIAGVHVGQTGKDINPALILRNRNRRPVDLSGVF